MAVNLEDSVIKQFELAGITKKDIGRTIERDRAAGIPDNEIELKAVAKAQALQEANPTFDKTKGGLFRAISNLPFGDTINRGLMSVKATDDAYTSVPTDAIAAAYDATVDYITGNNKPTIRQYLEAPEGTIPPDRSWKQLYKDKYNELRKDNSENFSESYNKNLNKLERTFREQNYDVPKLVRYPLDAAVTIGSYSLLPEGIYATVPRAAAFGAADAFQSGLNKSTQDRETNALIGGIATGALTGIVNRITNSSKALETATKQYPLLTEGFKENPPKTIEEASKRLYKNWIKYSSDKVLSGRVNGELETLYGSLSTKSLKEMNPTVFKSVIDDTQNAIQKILKSSGTKKAKTRDASAAVETLTKFRESLSKAVPTKTVNTEGLTGGIVGGIIGNTIGSGYPIIGALLGSKGKILPIGIDALKGLAFGSKESVAKAVLNPTTTSALTKALTSTATKTAVPLTRSLVSGNNSQYSNRSKNSSLYTTVPMTQTIIMPEQTDDTSVMQKRLELLKALYPDFFENK